MAHRIYPLPTPQQEDWADQELGVIIHYCMETYHPDLPMNRWKTSPDIMRAETFAPTDVDADGWLRAARAAGARYAVLVANHVTGFSLWPTRLNDYSIQSSPYKNGKADIVRDFIDACHKYGIKPGLYYSTGCNGYYGISEKNKAEAFSPAYREYVRVVEAQLTELWSQYGDLYEIWFDGGILPVEQGGPRVSELLDRYQPNAMLFQGGMDRRNLVRWVGNERGIGPLNCWSTAHMNTNSTGDTEDETMGGGSPDGNRWIPAEADMGNRKEQAFGGGWEWRAGEDHLVYTPEELLECYYCNVGRNANMLLGMAIDQTGHFPDAAQFEAFGALVRGIYENPVAQTRGLGRAFTLELERETLVRNLCAMEDLHYGERIRDFSLRTFDAAGAMTEFRAGCVGHKRLIRVDRPVKRAELIVHDCVDTPVVRAFAAYA